MEDMTTMPDAMTLEGAIVVIGLIILRQVFEIIAKEIPDSATGVMGGLRKLFRVLALHVTNKET